MIQIRWQKKDPWLHGWQDCCEYAEGQRHEWGRPPPGQKTRTDEEALARTQEILTEMGWTKGQMFQCVCRECYGNDHPPHWVNGAA